MTSPTHDPSNRPATAERLLAERGWMRALARSLVVDASAADDLAQDATVVALTRPLREPDALRGWLRRVVRNLASNARRAAGRRDDREAAAARSNRASDDPADVVALWEMRKAVVDAVLALDEPYRTTVLLRFFEGLAVEEIASRLGVPRDTVKTRQRRALEMLRARLEHLDDERGHRGLTVLLVLAHSDGDGIDGLTSGAARAASGTGTALVSGGVAMSMMAKGLVAAVVIATLAAGWWTLRVGDRRGDVGLAPAAPPSQATARPERAKRPQTPAADATVPTPASLASADRDRDLHGVVVDPDGRPVAGAAVEVLRNKPWIRLLAKQEEWTPYVTAETATSAADGTFSVRLAAGDGVAMRVDAAGFAIWESAYRQAGERVTVQLARATTLEIVVREAGLAPVARAVIHVRELNGDSRLGRDVLTDAAGRARVDRLARGAKVNVLVLPLAAPDAIRSLTLADDETQSVEIVLAQGFPVSGSVVDAKTGSPIAGARVARRDTFLGAVTTGPDGRFTLEGLERGHATALHADAAGYARGSASASVLASDTSGTDVRIALDPAARITGRVVAQDGSPVANVDLVALASWRTDDGDRRSLGAALSSADGAFDIGGLSPGVSHTLQIHAAGHGRVVRVAATPNDAPYALELGDVVLPAARTLRGVVVDGDDRPLARVDVVLTGPQPLTRDALREHRWTDDLGRFAFSDLAAGEFQVEANREALRTRATVAVVANADPAATTLVLATPSSSAAKHPVRMRVLDEAENPVEGVSVQAIYAANGASDSVPTDATGFATAPGAFPAIGVSVSFFGNESLALTYERPGIVFLRPGQTEREVVLRRIGGTAGAETITGRVVDADGGGVRWATISVKHDGGGAWNYAQAGDDGRFTIAVPRGSAVDLVAKPQPDRNAAPTFGEALGVRAGDPVEIVVRRLKGDRALDVTVVGRDNAPVVGALVNLGYDGLDWRTPKMAQTDAAGTAPFTGLPALPIEVYVILKDPAGRVNVSRTLHAASVASQSSVRIVVPGTRTIHGRVVLPDGSPCGGAFVHNSSVACTSTTVAAADGTFALDINDDEPMPFPIYANPLPPDQTKPLAGWDLVESFDRELEIRLGPVPVQ